MKTDFEKIAEMTGGECEFLDVNSEKGSKLLTDFISKYVLQSVADAKGLGTQLVDAYERQFSWLLT